MRAEPEGRVDYSRRARRSAPGGIGFATVPRGNLYCAVLEEAGRLTVDAAWEQRIQHLGKAQETNSRKAYSPKRQPSDH
jgi:hypothetical protein